MKTKSLEQFPVPLARVVILGGTLMNIFSIVIY